jgi:predicted GIY-YIG superfamily endonuclease
MTKCNEHPEFLRHGVQAKRRQYGLRHRIASTIHAGMGQDLPYVVTKVTDKSGDPNYQLWDKEQVVVLLSRTNYAKEIIFVGDKQTTSKALADLLKKRSQFTEYTNALLKSLSVSSGHSLPMAHAIDIELYPFRAIDYDVPTSSCGCVYLIQSRNPTMNHVTYIGETKNLKRRIKEHNDLRGSDSTSNVVMLPWALICFITGFDAGSIVSPRQIEQLWKVERDKLKQQYKRCLTVEETCNIGRILVTQKGFNSDLRFVQCCLFDT